jgi:ATP-dependent Clp protease protease subunit
MNGGQATAGLDDHIYQRLLKERIVFLGSEVKDTNANAICAQMLLLNAEDPDTDIFLYINSPGAPSTPGWRSTTPCSTSPTTWPRSGMGLAASMGQFLLCAGAKDKRYALPHARIMMHQPSGGLGGSASDIKIQASSRAHQAPSCSPSISSNPASRSTRSSATPTATGGSPPRRPRSTASSTTW